MKLDYDLFLYHYKLSQLELKSPHEKARNPASLNLSKPSKRDMERHTTNQWLGALMEVQGNLTSRGIGTLIGYRGVGWLGHWWKKLQFSFSPFIIHVVNKIPVASSYKSSSSVQIKKRICFMMFSVHFRTGRAEDRQWWRRPVVIRTLDRLQLLAGLGNLREGPETNSGILGERRHCISIKIIIF